MTATVIPFLIRREMERAAPASAGGNRLLKQLHEDAETLRQMLTTTKDGDELELILNCRAILRLRIEEWDFIVGKKPSDEEARKRWDAYRKRIDQELRRLGRLVLKAPAIGLAGLRAKALVLRANHCNAHGLAESIVEELLGPIVEGRS